LARFNSNEFAGLLLEILNESKRRYYNQSLNDNVNSNGSSESSSKKNSLTRNNTNNKQGGTKRDDILEEDDPLYDKVPSDEDYASVASESGSIFESNGNKITKQHQQQQQQTTPKKTEDPLTVSLNSSPTKSNKNTPSPSSATKFVSKEHKVLLTNFDKPQNYQQQQSSLVANAESALNSIINSLNQIDYSHLNSNPNQSQSTLHESKLSDLNNIDSSTQSTNKIVLNELKNENELMQAMVIYIIFYI
jgi:hypothetical protein